MISRGFTGALKGWSDISAYLNSGALQGEKKRTQILELPLFETEETWNLNGAWE